MIINRTENGVKNIQTAGYHGARTVIHSGFNKARPFWSCLLATGLGGVHNLRLQDEVGRWLSKCQQMLTEVGRWSVLCKR